MVNKRQRIMGRLKPLLEAVSDLDWYVSKDKSHGNYNAIRIRSCIKDAIDLGPCEFCPLTRLALLEKRAYYSIGDYEDAGELLGFDREDILAIASAADDRCVDSDERFIRAQMILILRPEKRQKRV